MVNGSPPVPAESSEPVKIVCPHVSQVEARNPEKGTCNGTVEPTHLSILVSAEPVKLVCPHASQVESGNLKKDTCDGHVGPNRSSSLGSVECPTPVQLVQPDDTLVGASDHEDDTSAENNEPARSLSRASNPEEGRTETQSSVAVFTDAVQSGCPGNENQRCAPTLRQSVGSKAPSLNDGDKPVPSAQAGEARPESPGSQPMEQKTYPRAPPRSSLMVLVEDEPVGLDLRMAARLSSELPIRPLINNAVSVSRQLLTPPVFLDNRVPACLCRCHCRCGSCCACRCKCN